MFLTQTELQKLQQTLPQKADLYWCANKQYGTRWKIQAQQQQNDNQNDDAKLDMMTRTNVQILKSDLPNISTQGQLFLDIRKTEKLMKNQTVAKKWGEKKGDEEMDAISKEMRKYDQNALRFKKFPVKPEQFQYPQHGLNVGNPIYMTAYQDLGRLKPTGYEIPERYFPINRHFTTQFSGGNYKFNGLNTNVVHSKVHATSDEF